VAIQYQALPVPVVDPRVSVNDYTNSIYDGVDKLIARMYQEAKDCPSTQFVLLGYSQGALAGHIALRLLSGTDPDMLNRFVGIAFVADPGRLSTGAEEWWRSASLDSGLLTVYAPDVFQSITSGVWSDANLLNPGAEGPLPGAIVNRTVALCHSWDMVCSLFIPGSNITQHTNYTSKELEALGYMLATEKITG
jgi:hypothetical protein